MQKIVLQQAQHNPEQSRRIGLVVDEGADLPKETIEKYQIEVVHFKMEWSDLEGLSGENTFQKMRELERRGIKSFGKTSQPSPKDFLDAFKKQLEKFEKIICITISSKLSGTYNSACQARNFLGKDGDRIFVIDSLNASSAEGLFVFRAFDLIEKGQEAKVIAKELETFISKVHLYGMISDPKWLEASGRLSPTIANWMRRVQKIGFRPVLGIKKGLIKAIGIKAGAKDISAALFNHFKIKTEKLITQGEKISPSTGLRTDTEQRRSIRVAITHSDYSEGAEKLKETIERETKGVEVVSVTLIDNVLGILVGPGGLILSWCEA